MTDVLCSFHALDPGGVQYVNTLCVRSENTGLIGPDPSLHDLLEGVHTWLWSKWMDCLSPDYSGVALRCFDISDPTTVAEKEESGAGQLSVSLWAATPMPKEAAMVLTLRTAKGGRRYRGRIFIPSPRQGSAMLDSTNWRKTGTGSNFYTAVGAFGSAITAGHDYTHGTELTPAHLSGRVWSRAGGFTTDITSTLRRDQVHWLRSRFTAP